MLVKIVITWFVISLLIVIGPVCMSGIKAKKQRRFGDARNNTRDY